MNRLGSESHVEDPFVWDRLVDNEWDEAERRALIASLDSRPDGWRCCALAFLEHQSLQADLCAMNDPPQAGVPTNIGPRRQRRPGNGPAARWLSGLALAASLAAAFALGRWAPHTPVDTSTPSAEQVAGSEITPSPANNETEPLRGADPHSGEPGRPTADAETADVLRLVVNNVEAGDMQVVEVPLLDAESVISRSEWDRQLPVPRETWKRWEEMGLAVTRKRRLAPLQLDDGRQVVFPVDEFEFTPIAHRMY